MKLLFITNVVNRIDFLEFQNYTLKKFCKNNYHFCVVDDSIDQKISIEFEKICIKNQISYFKKPSEEIKNPADACSSTIQWTYENVIQKIFSDYFIFYLDSDMFLIDYFEFDNELIDEYLGGVKQVREHIVYPWNGLMFLNMKKINKIDPKINFKNIIVDGIQTDVGGGIHFYMKKNNISFYNFDTVYPKFFENIDLHKYDLFKGFNLELHYNKKFLHYRAGTNWHIYDYWKKNLLDSNKNRIFKKIILKTQLDPYPLESFRQFVKDNSEIDTKKNIFENSKFLRMLKLFLKQIIKF